MKANELQAIQNQLQNIKEQELSSSSSSASKVAPLFLPQDQLLPLRRDPLRFHLCLGEPGIHDIQ